VDLKRYGWDPSRDLDDAQRATMLAGAIGAPTQPGERLLHLLHHDVASPFRQGGGG
jgi:methylated-DNA-protein-cysteine methyltransferase-like protein